MSNENIRFLSFDKATTGSGGITASGITAISGTWVIGDTDRNDNEPSAPSTAGGANKYLEGTDIAAGQRRIARITNSPDTVNFDLQLETRAFTDGTTYVWGVGFRGTTVGSSYALKLDAVNSSITLYDTAGAWRRIGQKITATGNSDFITTGSVYKVRINVNLTVIKVYVNGILSFQVTDSTYSGIGFYFFTESTHAWFDTISVAGITNPTIVRTGDWIKGVLFLERQQTGGDPNQYVYDSGNASSALAELITNNVNLVEVVVPAHMHTITSNDIWWDDDDDNHYNTSTSSTANDSKLSNILSSISGNTYIDNDGQTQNVQTMLNACRFKFTSGAWRGDLNPSNRSLWWDNYSLFIQHYAEVAEDAGADFFVIGSGLTNLEGAVNSDDITEWEDLITAVKAIYSGSIIYAVQASSTASVLQDIIDNATWLSEVDFIGINAYFELVGSYTMLGVNTTASATTLTLPTGEADKYTENTAIQIEDDSNAEINYITEINGDVLTLKAALSNIYTTAANARIVESSALSPGINDFMRGWTNDRSGSNPMEFVQNLSTAFGKPVLFTEIGYRSLMGAGMFPWEDVDPPTAKHTNILTYQNDTNNSWGWLADDILRESISTQENGLAAAITRWWDTDWFYGMVINGWTANPDDGIRNSDELSVQNGFWDADYTIQNKPALTVVSNMFAAPNVRDSLPTVTTYTTPEQVARMLQVPAFSSTTAVTRYEVIRLIKQAEDWVDLISRTVFRPIRTTEYYEYTGMGAKLNHDPIRTVHSVKIWNGSSFETKTEGRNAHFWVDLMQGYIYFTQNLIVQFIAPIGMYTFHGWGSFKRPIEVDYTYGRYSKATDGKLKDPFFGAVEHITSAWVAIQICRSNDYSVLFPSGVDKLNIESKIKSWQEDLTLWQSRQEKLRVI